MGGVLAAFSGQFNVLIAMRVIEGLAAGVLQVLPNIVIMRAFDQSEQGRVTGIFGFGIVMTPALGPSIGGVLIEAFGWRSIFFSVVPTCLAAIWLARRYLPRVSSLLEEKKPLDWPGLVWVGVSAVCLLNGLVELQHMESALPWALLAIGGVGLATFVVYQLRASAPLLNLRLFAYRQVSIGSMVAFAHGFAIFSSVYLLPMFLQTALAYSPSRSGFTLLPAGLVLAFTIPWGGRLADRHPPGPLVTGGLLVLVVSLLLTANVTQATPYALVLVWVALGRMGIGVMGPALQLGSLRGLALSDIPQAASITSFVRQFGGAAGVSVVASVLQWRMMANGLGVEPAEGSRSFIQAFEETFWFVAIFSGIAAMAGWFLSPKTAKKRHAV